MLYRSKHAEYCEYQIQSLYFFFQPALFLFWGLFVFLGCFFYCSSTKAVKQSNQTWHIKQLLSKKIIELFIHHPAVYFPELNGQTTPKQALCQWTSQQAQSRNLCRRGFCVCVFVCASACAFSYPGTISGGSWRPQRKARTSDLGARRLSLLRRMGYRSPFLHSISGCCHIRKHTLAHRHRKQPCQQLIFMHLNPYACGHTN